MYLYISKCSKFENYKCLAVFDMSDLCGDMVPKSAVSRDDLLCNYLWCCNARFSVQFTWVLQSNSCNDY